MNHAIKSDRERYISRMVGQRENACKSVQLALRNRVTPSNDQFVKTQRIATSSGGRNIPKIKVCYNSKDFTVLDTILNRL